MAGREGGREGGEAHNNSNISIVGHKGQQLPPREQDRARLQWGNNWAIYILKRRRRKRERWREAGTNDHLQSYGNTPVEYLRWGMAWNTALSVIVVGLETAFEQT